MGIYITHYIGEIYNLEKMHTVTLFFKKKTFLSNPDTS